MRHDFLDWAEFSNPLHAYQEAKKGGKFINTEFLPLHPPPWPDQWPKQTPTVFPQQREQHTQANREWPSLTHRCTLSYGKHTSNHGKARKGHKYSIRHFPVRPLIVSHKLSLPSPQEHEGGRIKHHTTWSCMHTCTTLNSEEHMHTPPVIMHTQSVVLRDSLRVFHVQYQWCSNKNVQSLWSLQITCRRVMSNIIVVALRQV